MCFKKILSLLWLLIISPLLLAQTNSSDQEMIRRIYNETLSNGKVYQNLGYLCLNIGGRLSGSPQAAKAVEWTRQLMQGLGADTVYLQPVKVPHWVRGKAEKAFINAASGKIKVPVCALGNAVGTGPKGVQAQVIEVKQLSELAQLGKEKVQGKIVFFNRPLDPTLINTFDAYGGAGDQRRYGPSEAAKFGAVGVIVRSLASNADDFPHTGATRYELNLPQLPAIAISTNGADLLSSLLKKEPGLQFYFESHCQMLPDVDSYNVIGEIRGSEKPEEIITVGGHLDSWDTGQGAHDDGAGCMQSVEILHTFKKLGYRPKRTIRIVMFMNEENGLRGGMEYAKIAAQKGEKHIAAMESDNGGFTPRDFEIDAEPGTVQKIARWQDLFKPYGMNILAGGGGADIGPLKPQGTVLINYAPDSQRYFDLHHTAQDTFDKVSKRELELGAAAMAAMTYLLSEYGI